jgi:tetratricopeptide (TPR) repeat protein
LAKGNTPSANWSKPISLFDAYELEKDIESIPRELSGVCLLLGRAQEAIEIGERAAGLKPDDYQALGNLACAYLIGGRLVEAQATIDAARKIDPNDRTNASLHLIIQRVRSGHVPQPKTLQDLTRSANEAPSSSIHPVKSKVRVLWNRLRFWRGRQ